MTLKDFFRREAAGMIEPWQKWQDALSTQNARSNEWIAELARVRASMHVLDIGSGIGDPALYLAERVGSEGQVVASDLVPAALDLLARRAAERGFTWLSTTCAEMDSLPFAACTFDAVTCRLGLMFSEDVQATLAEVRRVLKPGGRAAFVVWGTPRQPLFESTLGVVAELTGTEAPTGLARRFATPGALGGSLHEAGFLEVYEEARTLPWPFTGTAEGLWDMFRELAGPSFNQELAALEVGVRARVDALVAERLRAFACGLEIDPTATLVGAAGIA
jgi:SAM-dependent methyltransferase